MSEKYNGWTNYETWLIGMDLDGNYDRSVYYRVQDMIIDLRAEHGDNARALVGNLTDQLEAIYDERDHGCSVFTDLITASLSRVNWRELAESQLED